MRDLLILMGFCLAGFLLAYHSIQKDHFKAKPTDLSFGYPSDAISSLLTDPGKSQLMVLSASSRLQDTLNLDEASESESTFYKISRNLVILFFVLLLILLALFVKEWYSIAALEEAGLAKQRLQHDLEMQTRQGLQEKLAEKERQLAVATLALEEKNKILSDLKSNLQQIHGVSDVAVKSRLRPLSQTIDRNLNSQLDWTHFQLHFSKVHPRFFDKLKQQFPSLSANDLRICAYIRMNLSTKEIARLMHINHNSVQKARYRLKKKMGLQPEQDFKTFIYRF